MTIADDEVMVRTPTTAARKIDAAFLDRLTDDGWFHTGDLGWFDDDGFLWLDGRVSDMINRGGLKVFPGTVEDVLVAADGVREAAVVGVPDERLGEVPWAFVVRAGDIRDRGTACRVVPRALDAVPGAGAHRVRRSTAPQRGRQGRQASACRVSRSVSVVRP